MRCPTMAAAKGQPRTLWSGSPIGRPPPAHADAGHVLIVHDSESSRQPGYPRTANSPQPSDASSYAHPVAAGRRAECLQSRSLCCGNCGELSTGDTCRDRRGCRGVDRGQRHAAGPRTSGSTEVLGEAPGGVPGGSPRAGSRLDRDGSGPSRASRGWRGGRDPGTDSSDGHLRTPRGTRQRRG